jgi:hypothetical protein
VAAAVGPSMMGEFLKMGTPVASLIVPGLRVVQILATAASVVGFAYAQNDRNNYDRMMGAVLHGVTSTVVSLVLTAGLGSKGFLMGAALGGAITAVGYGISALSGHKEDRILALQGIAIVVLANVLFHYVV